MSARSASPGVLARRRRSALATVRSAARRSVLEEAVGATRFLARRGQRQEALRRYCGLGDPAAFLRFAVEQFPGPFSQLPEEILPFLAFASTRSPRVVSEIGTQFGGTNFLLSQAIPSVTTMVGVDLLVRNRRRLLTFRRPDQEILLINGSSRDDEVTGRVAGALAGRTIDLLFIDGDHRWDGVVEDFRRYRHLVTPGGLVVFHDIVPDDRLRGLAPTSAFAGEVPLLWDRLRSLFPSHEFVKDRTQEGFGIGVLEYDPAVVIPEGTFDRG